MPPIISTLFLILLVSTAACRSGGNGNTCVAGASAPCVCSDRRSGAQVCLATNTFGACSCTAAGQLGGCIPGQSSACMCSGGTQGAQMCQADRTFAICQCAGPDAAASCVAGRAVSCFCPSGQMGSQICQTNQTFGPCTCIQNGGPDAGQTDSGGSIAIAATVLDFPDPVTDDIAVHVNHGLFWADNADLGTSFFWDAYVAPRSPGGYLVSDGYGGAHAMLWGPTLSSDNQMIFQGDIWNGLGSISYASTEGPAPGEWGYHAVGMVKDIFNKVYIYNYWNGIVVGITPFGSTTRHSGNVSNGQGVLYVMGSSHQNLGGKLAALRVWDRASPFVQVNNPAAAFIPERTFSFQLGDRTPVDFLADYTRPAVQIQDLSPFGYAGGGSGPAGRHPGRIVNAPVRFVSPEQAFSNTIPNLGPLATWVVDSSCPYGVAGQLPPNPNEHIPSPSAAPAGALVFDSFGRRAQTFLWQQVPTLGKTEGGSLGPLDWKMGVVQPPNVPSAWGILNGRAVFLEQQAGIAWVETGISDQEVRIKRYTTLNPTGLAFRVQDKLNFWFAFVTSQVSSDTTPPIQIGYFQAGTPHPAANYVPPDNLWLNLSVRAIGDTVTVSTDYQGNNELVSIGSLGNATQLQMATGAGMTGATNGVGASSFWRGDNFTVCGAGGC
jgi:hypothetical protein